MREYLKGSVVSNWTARLCECLRSCAVVVCCCCYGRKVSPASESRQIEVGTLEEGSRKKHNKIKTSKYSLLWFLPKNLSEQFRRVVNFYFLIVTVIAIVIDSPVSPFTSIAPLSFMVLVTAVKQGYEDWLRHKADNRVNNQIVEIVHKGVIKEVKNSSISPGTLVRVRRGREVPADLVVLCAAGELGKCYVTTANLDGETNLKTLRVPPPLVGYTPDVLPARMRLEVPPPEADLYSFCGRLRGAAPDPLVLGTDHLMLRGSRLKNTEWAIGCAVYTGEETKLALNSKYTGNKFSSCELAINGFLVFFIFILIAEMIVSLAAKLLIERRNPQMDVYLGPGTPIPAPIGYLMQDFFSFLLLYYYIIPMSLYVTIELYKFIGALFIGWDEELRCAESGRGAVANTSDLNEELGQVEVLFSDKTGTLTQNRMLFKACSVRGRRLELRAAALYDLERRDHQHQHQPVDVSQTDIEFFFTILALCHSVQISNEDMRKLSARFSGTGNMQLMNFFKRKKVKSPTPSDNTNNDNNNGSTVLDDATWNNITGSNGSAMDYQASSPDERALVEAAARLGVVFLGEEGSTLLVRVGARTRPFERLHAIDFSSERQRMSVILRDRDGRILLFCKGAESSVFPLCKNSALVEETNRDINVFANKGLRTLAVAFRVIPEPEYQAVGELIKKMDGKSAEGLAQMGAQYRVLERSLTLVGATAVEDCLQDDVADTLAALRRAGIRTWVLTGDKIETAISVSQSCAHISESDRRVYVVGGGAGALAALAAGVRAAAEPAWRDLTLVLDGAAAAELLDTPHAARLADLALRCTAVLCCRLSPIQKAKIVKLIKNSPRRPITAAIGDGANDISMIQEAHVGFGIFGKEGHQAARSADFAFTKFSMVKKMLLVMGHWYYQRLATLIHYFFYKNLVLGNIMFSFQLQSAFSTQSIYDSMYLTLYNLVFTSLPCLLLSVTEQRWPKEVLLKNPLLYRDISRNKLMTWGHFLAWCLSAAYHSVVIYLFAYLCLTNAVLSADGKTIDLWCYGALLFHLMMVVVSLKLWLHARYHTTLFVLSVLLSVLLYVAFNTVYSMLDMQIDGDVLGTYTRLLQAPAFWFLNAVVVAATLWPDMLLRLLADKWGAKLLQASRPPHTRTVFSTHL